MNYIDEIVWKFDSKILHQGLKKIHGEIVDKLIELRDDLSWDEICYALHSMNSIDRNDDPEYYDSRLSDGYIFELSDDNLDWICDDDNDYSDKIEDDLYTIIDDFYSDFLEKNNIEIEIDDYPNESIYVARQSNSENYDKKEFELLELVEMINKFN